MLASNLRSGAARLDVLFGDGQGGYPRTTSYETGEFASDLQVVDVNDDGRPDVVAATFDSILVFPGSGNGVLAAPTRYATSAFRISTADMNGDGHLDIVANFGVDIWFGAGDGSVGPPQGFAPFAVRPRTADMNRDGVPDIVLGGASGILYGQRSETNRPQVADAGPTGEWGHVQDATAARGLRAFNPDGGEPKVVTPRANPADYIDIFFVADPTQEYKLWIRGKADKDFWGNDSAWVQFDLSTTPGGAPAYRIGTASALPFNLEECSGCGISGWGWENDGWGAVNRNGVTIKFEQGGVQRMRIQTREDGLSVDQIVLSAVKYKTERPGKAKNDGTILPERIR